MRNLRCTAFLACLIGTLSAPTMAGTAPLEADIVAVQGSGLASPLVGQTVHIGNGVVTAVFDGGLFIQMPDADADDPAALTSNGLRVQTAGFPAYATGGFAAMGHRVSATGVVQEVGGETRLILDALVRNDQLMHPMPQAVELSAATGMPRQRPDNLSCALGLSNFECLEGMRLFLPEGVASGGNRPGEGSEFGAVFISPLGTRSFREKGVRDSAMLEEANLAAGIWDGNPETLRMQPYQLGVLGGTQSIAGGARFASTGVLAVQDGDYMLWPQSLAIESASNVLPQSLPPTGTVTTLRMASFDLVALCDDVAGNTTAPCRDPEPDTAEVSVQGERLADYIDRVLGAPAILALQQVENTAALQILAAELGLLVSGSDYRVHLVEGTDARGLDIAFLVDDVRVEVLSVAQQASGQLGSDGLMLHSAPPLLLTAAMRDASGPGQVFRVLNLRIDDRQGVDVGNAGVRQRRFDQARSLADLVQALQHVPDSATAPLLVAGKFHGWDSTDGIVDTLGLVVGSYFNPENLIDVVPFNPVSPLLWNSAAQSPPEQRLTALGIEHFGTIQGAADRQVQVAYALDHVLLSLHAQQLVTFTGIGRGNADAPVALRTLGTGAVASSDFDAIVVDLDPGCRGDPLRNPDADAWCNLRDNCPNVSNDDQLDFDGDGVGDPCDPDVDGDGIANGDDNCPLLPNPDQRDSNGDGVGDVCDADSDGDGIDNALDNCPLVANPGQEDFDADGLGDACDPNADMSVALQVQPTNATPGGTLQLTADVANLGPQTVQEPRLSITLTSGLSFTSLVVVDWTCGAVNGSTSQVVCERASLAPGNSQLSLTLQVAEGLQHGQQLEIAAELDPDDLDPSNNVDVLSVDLVVESTDLRLVLVGPSPQVNVGDRLDLLATVNNLGLRDVGALLLEADHSAGGALSLTTPDPEWNCTAPSATSLDCGRALAAGGQATLAYTLEVLPTASGQLVISFVLGSEIADDQPGNNTASLTFTVVDGVSGTFFADGFEGTD